MITLVAVGCANYSAMKGPFDGNAVTMSFVEDLADKADDKLDLNDAQQYFTILVLSSTKRSYEGLPVW